MNLATAPYLEQRARWPREGRHVLAQFDERSVVVYQAFRESIARFAVTHGHFGGEFRLDRMSWVKTNFLWMMYRSGWATKRDQEVILAVHLRRSAFESILAQTVPSSFVPALYGDEAEWRAALESSSVRLQWDPDHDPAGHRVQRRAVQLGLRGEVLARYAREWIERIEDMTPFVAAQRPHAAAGLWERLVTPREEPFPVEPATAQRLGMAEASPARE